MNEFLDHCEKHGTTFHEVVGCDDCYEEEMEELDWKAHARPDLQLLDPIFFGYIYS